jgi:hypothetical protein
MKFLHLNVRDIVLKIIFRPPSKTSLITPDVTHSKTNQIAS